MFLIGGYYGDWNASSKNSESIKENAQKIERVQERVAVMDNRLKNIEENTIEIKKDMKRWKN